MVFHRYHAYQSIQPQKCQFTSLLFSHSAETQGREWKIVGIYLNVFHSQGLLIRSKPDILSYPWWFSIDIKPINPYNLKNTNSLHYFFLIQLKTRGVSEKIWVFTLIFLHTRAANSFKTWYLMLPLMVFHRYQAYQSIQPQKYQFTSLLFSQSAENRGVSEKYGYLP